MHDMSKVYFSPDLLIIVNAFFNFFQLLMQFQLQMVNLYVLIRKPKNRKEQKIELTTVIIGELSHP